MNPSSRHRWRPLLASLTWVLTAALVATPSLAAAHAGTSGAPGASALPRTAQQDPAQPDPEEETLATVTVTAIEPAVLRPQDDLEVTVTLTNTSAAEIAEPEVRLSLQSSAPISRSALDFWFDAEFTGMAQLVERMELDDPLAAGQSTEVTISVPAENLPLDVWGPRGFLVELREAAVPARPLAHARNVLVWWPDLELPAAAVAVLVPLVATTAERAEALTTGTSVAAVAENRLVDLIESVDAPGVDYLIDPALLVATESGVEEAQVDTDDPSASPSPPSANGATGDEEATDGDSVGNATESPTEAATAEDGSTDSSTDGGPDDGQDSTQDDDPGVEAAGGALLEALTAVADRPGRGIHALAWLDADLAALARADADGLYQHAVNRAAEELAEVGLPSDTTVAWPVAEAPDLTTLAAAHAAGARTAVLPAASMPPSDVLTYTPAGRTVVDLGEQTIDALLWEERLSALAVAEHLRFAGEDLLVGVDALTARQLLLADTAVIARERPADVRELVIALPRAEAVDAEQVAAVLDALHEAPWLAPTALADLEPQTDTTLLREPLPDEQIESGELSAAELDEAGRVIGRAEAVAGITGDPEAITDPIRAELDEILSAAWRADPARRGEIVESAAATVEQWHTLVAAQPGSTLNLINNEAHIPVTVINEMAGDIDVLVELVPGDPRLVAEEIVELRVPAGQSAVAQVPVTAVGSGDVVVDVRLLSPELLVVGEPAEIQVRVRADWETVGTAIIAAALALMLVVGLIRTVRRGRRRETRAAPEDATPGSDAPAPEQASGTSEEMAT